MNDFRRKGLRDFVIGAVWLAPIFAYCEWLDRAQRDMPPHMNTVLVAVGTPGAISLIKGLIEFITGKRSPWPWRLGGSSIEPAKPAERR